MQNQLPSYLQALQAPDIGAALSANLGSAMPPHVSIGGGRFTLIDAGNNEIPVPTFDPAIGVYLDACIIDVNEHVSRIYFAGSYDPNQEGTRPDCFSDNGVAPSISASAPQAHSCMPDPTGVQGCKWAVWGSKINANGKGVPACSSKQKIALLIPGFQTLFLLAVPPNSHGPLREYTEKCKGNGINMANLITRISFVPGVQGTLQFAPVTYIDEPTAQLRQAAYAEKKTDAMVGRNDVPRPAGAIAAPVTQAAPPVQHAATQQIAPPAQQWPAQTQQPVQQVQQPGPFAGTPAAGAAPANGQWTQNPAPTAATTGPSDPAPAQRRRRRTAAEMQAANGAPPNGQAPLVAPQPGTGVGGSPAPQAPFPHPGQTVVSQPAFVANPPGPTAPQGSFGIAQPAAANPELAGMLDDFFKS
jgi:hypothetical protein